MKRCITYHFTHFSCQRHLTALVEFAQQEGKTIQFKFIAHPKMKQLGNINDLAFTRKYGQYTAHAEVQALNDLAHQKFGNTLVSDEVFDT